MRPQDTVVNICRLSLGFALLHVSHSLEIGTHKASANLVSEGAGRLASLVQQLHRREAERSLHGDAERARARIQDAELQDKARLQDAYEILEESRMEEENAQGMASSLAATLQHFSGGATGASSCAGLTCGGNGYCDETAARCKCKAGYQGTGLVCNPSASFAEHPLISEGSRAPQVADLHVTSLRDNHLAVAFRDVSRQSRGFVVIGVARDEGMRWSAPALLSSSAAFGPVLAELDSPNALAIAFRTEDRGGDGVILGARRDGENRIQLGSPRIFARHQAQGMTLIALPESRVVVLFAEHEPKEGQWEHYGASLLAEMASPEKSLGEAPRVLGKYRFVKGPVSRLSAAPISSKGFAIAYRHLSGGEASVSLAELWGSELVFTTKPLSLEPQARIWARSVAGLGNGAFAYTYHSGAEQVTKQAVLRLNDQHRLEMLQEPRVVASGFSPFVSTVSTLQRDVPHRLFTFLGSDSGAKGHGQICSVNASGIDRCESVGTSGKEVLGVASSVLSDERVFLLTTSAKGIPYYTLVGLAP